jgi:hypothetical protein
MYDGCVNVNVNKYVLVFVNVYYYEKQNTFFFYGDVIGDGDEMKHD